MSNDCGGCQHWWKAKSRRCGETYGICEKLDLRCLSDHGHNCPSFKHKPKPETTSDESSREQIY